jgi:hypothetical protein
MVTYPLEQFEEWFKITGNWWPDDSDPDNLIIHVQGDVKLKWPLTGTGTLPYTFAEVSGNFDCHGSGLKVLTGSPRKVGGNFDAGWNPITSLAGGPAWVGGNYSVQECHDLINVSDVAHHVGGEFVVGWRKYIGLLKPLMNSARVSLQKPPHYSSWDDIHDMQLAQTVFDEYKGAGKAGTLKAAAQLIRMGYKQTARM